MPETLPSLWPYLPGMAILIAVSGFFSGSEAAFFSLTLSQRRSLKPRSRSGSLAKNLLERPERLLMGILFWNLAINIGYFSLVSQASLQLEPGSPSPALFTLASLMAIIVLGEFIPKSLAVLYPLTFIPLVAVPLTIAIRILDAFLPVIKVINEASRRLVWPGLKPEPYLELSDLDRAVELSTDNSQLYEHERLILRNIIHLSEIRVEEWMRPRTQYRSFTPPFKIEDLGGQRTPSGYILLNDKEGIELQATIDLPNLLPHQLEDLNQHKQSLVVVPWCCTIADALKCLREGKRRIAVVVNEFGETIGILTWDEIFEAILQTENLHSQRELAIAEVQLESPGVWIATGMTKLRRLERVLGRRLEFSRSLTVGGVVQEQLKRLPETGDICFAGDLKFEVVETAARGETLVRISDSPSEGTVD
ncbi:CNNM domain-containing protein [Aureliella helgolandensis]|uniref:Magnesium and cobalt efflux protein CorC n=1 Tax=Aureliella helgolandensis TaxID=2527968 RepID=A0A518GG82_9BACT|nr:CNNM domain-containing protein [Aureliella helgolandensis]QDV27558.1 Magnesium and cobalt efflux protein CorC [Aureliella helgolandensis]